MNAEVIIAFYSPLNRLRLLNCTAAFCIMRFSIIIQIVLHEFQSPFWNDLFFKNRLLENLL